MSTNWYQSPRTGSRRGCPVRPTGRRCCSTRSRTAPATCTSECGPPRKSATDAGAGALADVAVTGGIITVIAPARLADRQASRQRARRVRSGSFAGVHRRAPKQRSRDVLPERWPDVTVAPLRQGVTTEVRGNCGLRPVSRTPQYFDQFDAVRRRKLPDWTSGWLRLADACASHLTSAAMPSISRRRWAAKYCGARPWALPTGPPAASTLNPQDRVTATAARPIVRAPRRRSPRQTRPASRPPRWIPDTAPESSRAK